jgi:hypothetical protein
MTIVSAKLAHRLHIIVDLAHQSMNFWKLM